MEESGGNIAISQELAPWKGAGLLIHVGECLRAAPEERETATGLLLNRASWLYPVFALGKRGRWGLLQSLQAHDLTKERQSMYRATIDPRAAVSDPALAPYFTGPALQLVLTSPESSPELEVRAVFFGRGVRSRWHCHPYPQIVFLLSGVGLLGIDDAEQELRPGEVITLPAQIWHWHGASGNSEVQMLSIMRPGPIQWRESLGDTTSG